MGLKRLFTLWRLKLEFLLGKQKRLAAQAILEFLDRRGKEGATLDEIRDYVNQRLEAMEWEYSTSA